MDFAGSLTRRRFRQGFSMIELVVVVAIIMVIAAIATPAILSSVNAYKLRTAASGVAAIFQKTRMQAVTDDRWYPVHMGDLGGADIAWGDLNNDSDVNANEKAMVASLPKGITFASDGPSISTMALDFTPVIGLPAFNARGIPCLPAGPVCPLQTGAGGTQGWSGYIYYLRQDLRLDRPGWAAITVTPAGRVKAWTWNGSAWN